MSDLDIIRAWKDKTYRNSLSAEQLAQLPENPAGAVDLTDDELANIGATTPSIISTVVATLGSLATIITVVTSVAYTSYRTGTNGPTIGCCTNNTAKSCCPCPYGM